MDPETIRMIERIIIDLFAGMSIILGWHLFKIGVVSPQSGIFSGQGFKVSLQKVGPGIFFSLFGTVILSIALVYGLSKDTTKEPNGKERERFNAANPAQKTALKRLTEAINTLDLIDVERSAPYKTHKVAIAKAIEQLQAYRKYIVRQQFHEKNLKAYEDCKKSADKTCNQTESYKEIHKWYTENML